MNVLNEVKLFARKKERGKSMNKRCWAIEDNEGRELNLEIYGAIDALDYCIKNVGIHCRS